jgi:hypothetical protein
MATFSYLSDPILLLKKARPRKIVNVAVLACTVRFRTLSHHPTRFSHHSKKQSTCSLSFSTAHVHCGVRDVVGEAEQAVVEAGPPSAPRALVIQSPSCDDVAMRKRVLLWLLGIAAFAVAGFLLVTWLFHPSITRETFEQITARMPEEAIQQLLGTEGRDTGPFRNTNIVKSWSSEYEGTARLKEWTANGNAIVVGFDADGRAVHATFFREPFLQRLLGLRP